MHLFEGQFRISLANCHAILTNILRLASQRFPEMPAATSATNSQSAGALKTEVRN